MANKVKALQQWCKQQVEGYRDVNVTNMTSSWRSGLAFCALIHRYRPDLIDYDSLSKDDVYENNALAFRVAKESLNIPDLLDAEDMVAMAVPDKLCIVTYVSQYYNTLHRMKPAGGPDKRGSPLKRPQTTTPIEETQAKRFNVDNKEIQKNTPAVRSTTKQSLGDKCHICHQKVYLMERHLEAGKLYHRHCFRESQKSSFRAYRNTHSLKSQASKENVSPTASKPTTKATVNGTTASSAKSMAKMWDTKIAEGKKAPQSSVSSASTEASSSSPSATSSPALSVVSTSKLPSAASAAPDTNLTLSPTHKTRPKTWGVGNGSKPRTALPWSPSTAVSSKTVFPVSPTSASSSSSASSPTSQSSLFQPRSFPPRPGSLSPSAEGLFPHYGSGASSRAVPAAPAEAMDVDEDCSVSGVPPGAAAAASAAAAPASPPVRPPPPSSSQYQPALSTSDDTKPLWKKDESVRTSLLASLSNIRQRYDANREPDVSTSQTEQQSTNSISSTHVIPQSPKKTDQPKSILKTEDTSAKGPKPILKHKDPVSFNDCDSSKPPDSRPLKSILKSGADIESGPNSTETSPRSILKHHDDSSDEKSPRSVSHSILKTDTSSAAADTAGDLSRRSILKTKDTAGICDSESSAHHDDSSRPVRSILKSRKSSGDSLLGSSGDELEDISPRPILKTSPRADFVVSPSSEPKSILKTKTPPMSNSPRDSPKPILKSRESSPTRSMSPLRMMEPVKPILKKATESPTPVKNPSLQSAKSPTGPSVLKLQQSDDHSQNSSSFAAFKSPKAKNYTSNQGLGATEKSPPREPDTSSNNRFMNIAMNKGNSAAIATSQTFESDRSKVKQPQLPIDRDIAMSNVSGAKKTDKSHSLLRPKEEEKPEWMIEAEKRQMARKGKYEDPEKVPQKKPELKEKPGTRTSGVSKPFDSKGVSDRKKPAAVVVPMEVDDRPEWQKEAEKRKALRNGGYPDPEKAPVRPKDRISIGINEKGSEVIKEKPVKPLPPARPANAPSGIAGEIGKRPVSAIPPPKPVRSPLPQRAHNADRPKTTIATKPTRPAWQTEAERRQTALQNKMNQSPEELQRKKKTRAPARPPPPSPRDKKKILPDTDFNFGDKVDMLTPNGSQYAEIGPPSRRTPGGKTKPPSERDSKFANRPLPPVPDDQDVDAPPKRRVAAEARMSNRTILENLENLDVELQVLEQQGRDLEEKIRSESDDAMDEADLMIAWFELVNNKNELVRKESDLMYRQRQQELEDQHEELEYELRCLMEKTDKTPSEKIREEALLQELVETVMLRNNIVDSIEEDRIRYLEEDQEIAEMMEAKVYNRSFSLKDDSSSQPVSPKSRNGKEKKKEKKEKHRRLVKSCVH